ncbi:MAG TPA: peptidoglycan-binding protein [Povalibacter sp.]|nr:peptidoglycan-binding protein [Povalibacter sp.]
MTGKSMTASVGQGGVNAAADVMLVQYLLNCVPVSQGGPISDLAVDGIMGPKTLQSIVQFQKTQFGKSDGRVDPEKYGGHAIVSLSAFDPIPDSPPPQSQPAPKYPSQPEGKGAAFAKGASGKSIGGGASGKWTQGDYAAGKWNPGGGKLA